MNKSSVAVVILNFNGKLFLEKFLPTLISNSGNHQIYIADNASSDDSISFLKTNFTQINIIQLHKNYGYAKGYNMALKQINSDFYVLLNSDVEVSTNWIEPVIKLMEHNEKIAACQPKLLDYTNREEFEYAGASGGFIDNYGYPFCRGRIFNSLEKDAHQYDDATEIFWATGACLFVKAKAFWEVGGLDDDYFAHMEEIDLCWRLKNVGYSIFVEPKAIVYHVGGGTLDKLSPQKTYLNFRNNLITLTKNHQPNFLIIKLFYRFSLDGIAALKFLFNGQPTHFFAVIKAHFAYYKRLPQTLNKREKLKTHVNFKFNRSLIYNGNMVFEYFIRKRKKFNELQNRFFSK